jgi:hypothetical protein
MSAVSPVVPSIVHLQGLLHRARSLGVALPDSYCARHDALFAKLSGPMDLDAARAWLVEAIDLTHWGGAFMEEATEALMREKAALGTPGDLKVRRVMEPKARASALVNNLKARFAAERAEWPGRLRRQELSIIDEKDRNLAAMKVTMRDEGASVVMSLSPEWATAWHQWTETIFATWRGKLIELLLSRYREWVPAAVEEIAAAIGPNVHIDWSLPSVTELAVPERVTRAPEDIHERFERPSAAKSIVNTVKGNLSIVMAGGTALAGILGFSGSGSWRFVLIGVALPGSVLAMIPSSRREATRLRAEREVKAREAIQRTLDADFRKLLDGWRPRADVMITRYARAVEDSAVAAATGAVQSAFDRIAAEVERDSVEIPLQAFRLDERIGQVRQARSTLLGTLLVDLQRRRGEMGV